MWIREGMDDAGIRPERGGKWMTHFQWCKLHGLATPTPQKSNGVSIDSILVRVSGIVIVMTVGVAIRGGAFDSCSTPSPAYRQPLPIVSAIPEPIVDPTWSVGAATSVGDFTVVFPRLPTILSAINSRGNVAIMIRTYIAETPDKDSLICAEVDDCTSPSEVTWDVQKELAGKRNELLAILRADGGVGQVRVIEAKNLPLKGLPGQYLRVRDESDGSVVYYHAGFRVSPSPRLSMFVVMQGRKRSFNDADVKRFFGSIVAVH